MCSVVVREKQRGGLESSVWDLWDIFFLIMSLTRNVMSLWNVARIRDVSACYVTAKCDAKCYVAAKRVIFTHNDNTKGDVITSNINTIHDIDIDIRYNFSGKRNIMASNVPAKCDATTRNLPENEKSITETSPPRATRATPPAK